MTACEVVAEGKTKTVLRTDVTGEVLVRNRDDITAFDDPSYTRQFATKAVSATTTTCRVFELLRAVGVPVAFIGQEDETTFRAQRCQMLPLEAVVRRLAVGSILKRHPELSSPKRQPPHRFDQLWTEYFLKTTGGRLVAPDGTVLVEGLNPQQGEEDPLVEDPLAETWQLLHPKLPSWVDGVRLGRSVPAEAILGDKVTIGELDRLLRQTFLVLEGAWAQLGCQMVDFKVEFGQPFAGKVVVADVVDNDSWRLLDPDKVELSKQRFRDQLAAGEEPNLAQIEELYALVAAWSERLRIPQQALVLWRGSPKDEFPAIGTLPAGVKVVYVTGSGHKATRCCLEALNWLQADYPEGGVIIGKVGLSNGLDPILSTHTSWPVIAVPVTAGGFPEDVWSSLRLPSEVPVATVLTDQNAVSFALRLLAQKNPAAYAALELEREQLEQPVVIS